MICTEDERALLQDVSSAWYSHSNLGKKESGGRNLPQGVAPRATRCQTESPRIGLRAGVDLLCVCAKSLNAGAGRHVTMYSRNGIPEAGRNSNGRNGNRLSGAHGNPTS